MPGGARLCRTCMLEVPTMPRFLRMRYSASRTDSSDTEMVSLSWPSVAACWGSVGSSSTRTRSEPSCGTDRSDSETGASVMHVRADVNVTVTHTHDDMRYLPAQPQALGP